VNVQVSNNLLLLRESHSKKLKVEEPSGKHPKTKFIKEEKNDLPKLN